MLVAARRLTLFGKTVEPGQKLSGLDPQTYFKLVKTKSAREVKGKADPPLGHFVARPFTRGGERYKVGQEIKGLDADTRDKFLRVGLIFEAPVPKQKRAKAQGKSSKPTT